jgi:acyl-homoserine-lactone acylase
MGRTNMPKQHGDTINALFSQVLPIVPTDITAGIQNVVHFHFMPSQDLILILIPAWESGGISAANALACDHTPGCPTSNSVALMHNPRGSNGWAIAPKKSASGNAILMGNPHAPWGNNSPVPGLGAYQWMEVNLVIGPPGNPELNASGAVLMGAPFIGIGYSDELGWTHTNNTIQNTNLYELTLNPNGTYNFGGKVLPLQHRTDTIKIRQADGSLVRQTIDIVASVHGPVVATSKKGDKALSLRVAGLEQPSVVTQYWGMIRAHNLNDFIAANSALQMPFFNVIYADRDGHILYLFGGQQPKRKGGNWSQYAGILDGSDPSLLWSETETFAWSELPRAIDPPGSFVANGNDPPWTSTFPRSIDPASFPAYVAPQFMDLRAQNSALLLLSNGSLTPAQVLLGKESTHMLLADRVLPDLIAAANLSGNPLAQQAAAVLAAWDRNSDAMSKGAVLFEAWWVLVMNDPNLAKDNTINFYWAHPQFRAGWDPLNPLSTPAGLANAAAMVADLIRAAQLVQAAYGALDVAWGDVHKIVLVTHDPTFQKTIPLSDDPQSGADDPFGSPRAVFRFTFDGIHYFGYHGDGYVQLVEFAKKGAKASALLGYGNASRPGSPHVTDQLPFFDAKTLRPVYRTRDDVERHTVSREVIP